jgi:putative hydrolase of the HAD superfamily
VAEGRRFDAVFLDLDSTLLDESYVVVASVSACQAVAREYPGLDAAALAKANYEVWMAYWPEIEDRWVLGTYSTDELRHETWRRTLARVGRDDEALLARVIEAHHGFELAEYPAFEDVSAALDVFRSNGVKLVVVTNGASDTQREKLDVLGLTDRVDAIMISGELGVAKPDPRIFEAALSAAGVPADRAVHIGDSLRADVGGALAAGVTAVWLNRTGATRAATDPVPDFEVDSLAGLVALAGLAS